MGPGQRSAPTLRSTCGCYLTNAPALFGGTSSWRSAAQLGTASMWPEWQVRWRIGVQGLLLEPLIREAFVPLVRGLLPRIDPEAPVLIPRKAGSHAR